MSRSSKPGELAGARATTRKAVVRMANITVNSVRTNMYHPTIFLEENTDSR